MFTKLHSPARMFVALQSRRVWKITGQSHERRKWHRPKVIFVGRSTVITILRTLRDALWKSFFFFFFCGWTKNIQGASLYKPRAGAGKTPNDRFEAPQMRMARRRACGGVCTCGAIRRLGCVRRSLQPNNLRCSSVLLYQAIRGRIRQFHGVLHCGYSKVHSVFAVAKRTTRCMS